MTTEYTQKILNQIFWPDDTLTPEERNEAFLRQEACRERHEGRIGTWYGHDSDGLHAGYKGK